MRTVRVEVVGGDKVAVASIWAAPVIPVSECGYREWRAFPNRRRASRKNSWGWKGPWVCGRSRPPRVPDRGSSRLDMPPPGVGRTASGIRAALSVRLRLRDDAHQPVLTGGGTDLTPSRAASANYRRIPALLTGYNLIISL